MIYLSINTLNISISVSYPLKQDMLKVEDYTPSTLLLQKVAGF